MTIAFLDCEFTGLHARPSLLSLALVSLGGGEHYAELDLSTSEGLTRRKAATGFVQREVLVQWGMLPAASGPEHWMARSTATWLQIQAAAAFGTLQVAYDFHTDYEILEDLLSRHALYGDLEQLLVPTHVGYLLDEGGKQAADASLAAESVLRQHHALADARALRAAYLAAHG